MKDYGRHGQCKEQVHDWGRGAGFHRCDNRAKDERGLCGVHLRVEEQKVERDARFERDYAERRRLSDIASHASDVLGRRVNVRSRPFKPLEYTGDFEVVYTEAELLALIKEREGR